MRFVIQTVLAVILTSSIGHQAFAGHADGEQVQASNTDSEKDAFAALVAEGYAAEKRLHRKLLRALGSQNLPKQASIETTPSESVEFEVRLVPNR